MLLVSSRRCRPLRVAVTLLNELDDSTALHFHGMRQVRADGRHVSILYSNCRWHACPSSALSTTRRGTTACQA